MGLGTFVQLDISSVKTKAEKTATFLKNKLSNKTSMQPLVVVFLGEQHKNATDMATTQAVLTNPPLTIAGSTRVVFERLLNNNYVPAAVFNVRTEPVNTQLSKKARSVLIADMVQDAFDNHGMQIVYVVCGSEHAQEIFHNLDKRMANPFSLRPAAVSPATRAIPRSVSLAMPSLVSTMLAGLTSR